MSGGIAPEFDERLGALLDEVRVDGLRVGVGERVAVEQLLASLRVGGWRGEPVELGTWIAPIVCRSAAEQTAFLARFEDRFGSAPKPAPPVPREPPDERVAAMQWAWWTAGALVLLAVGVGLIIAARPRPNPTPPADDGEHPELSKPWPTEPRAGVKPEAPQAYDVVGWSRGFGPIVLRGHQFGANSAEFSRDGSRVVTAGEDSTARIWRSDGQGEPITLRGHSDSVRDAAFDADGSRVVTASADKTARIWRSDGQAEPIVLSGHEDQVRSAAFSRDGSRIVTASSDRTARIWRSDGQGEPIVLRGHGDGVEDAAFDADGSRVVTASRDGTVRVWRSDGQGEATVLQRDAVGFTSAAFSPDGLRVVAGCVNGTARIWRSDGQGDPIVLRGHEVQVWSAAFSSDGTRVITASSDGYVRVWSSDGEGEPLVLREQKDAFLSAAISPDGSRVVTAAAEGTVRIWRIDGPQPRLVLRGSSRMRSIALGPDGSHVVVGSEDGSVQIWRTDAQAEPLTLAKHDGPVLAVAYSSDGNRIVTASSDHTARVLRTDGTGEPVELKGDRGPLWSAAFSHDGSRVATACDDGTVRVWNSDGVGDPVVLTGHQDSVRRVSFSPDGRFVLTASDDRTARLWPVEGGEPVVTVRHQDAVNGARFSRDGTRFVTASSDGTAVIRESRADGESIVLRGHDGAVLSAGFGPNDSVVVTTSADRTARIWRADGSGEPAVLRGHEGAVLAARFLPDGKRLVTSSADGMLCVWEESADGWRPFEVIRPYADRIDDLKLDPDGRLMATVHADGSVRIWDVPHGETAAAAWPGIAALVGVVLASTWFARRALGSIALRRRPPGPDARYTALRLSRQRIDLMDTEELRVQSVRLRMRRRVETRELDVERTIDRTAEAGGLLQVAHARRREAPAYLALVERTSPDDHLASHADRRIERLRKERVLVESGSFLGDPAVVALPEKGCSAAPIDELRARFREHRVWIVGDPAAAGGGAAAWAEQISDWSNRAMLVPDARSVPRALRERLDSAQVRLAEAGRPTTSLDESAARPRRGYASGPFPPSIAVDPERWLSPTPPDAARVAKLLDEVQAYLGDDGYRWCCACAVYPELHYELTLDLGRLVLGEDGLHEDGFLRLARLPWFRHGTMPDWLRRELLDDLPAATARSVRDRFLRRLTANEEPDTLDLPVAVDARGPLRDVWRALVRQESPRLDAPAPLRDAVFIDWMDDRVVSVALARRVARDLARRTRRGAAPEHRRNTLVAALGTGVAGALLAWALAGAPRLGPIPLAAVAVWVYGNLVAAVVRFHRGKRALGELSFELAFLVGAACGVWTLTRGAASGPGLAIDFVAFAAALLAIPATWIGLGLRDRDAGRVGRLADRILLDRIASWFARDFSAGQPDPARTQVPDAVPARAAVASAIVAALIAWIAWMIEWEIGAHEWVWTSAGALLAALFAVAVLSGSKRGEPNAGKHVGAEICLSCVAVLGATAATAPESVRWLVGLGVSVAAGIVGSAAVAAIASFRKRRHPVYDVVAPLETAAAVVAPGALMARFVPDRIARVEATKPEPSEQGA